MHIHWLGEMTQYIFEAVVRIFWSEHDQYPAIGMFAFYGEIPATNFSDWPEA